MERWEAERSWNVVGGELKLSPSSCFEFPSLILLRLLPQSSSFRSSPSQSMISLANSLSLTPSFVLFFTFFSSRPTLTLPPLLPLPVRTNERTRDHQSRTQEGLHHSFPSLLRRTSFHPSQLVQRRSDPVWIHDRHSLQPTDSCRLHLFDRLLSSLQLSLERERWKGSSCLSPLLPPLEALTRRRHS